MAKLQKNTENKEENLVKMIENSFLLKKMKQN